MKILAICVSAVLASLAAPALAAQYVGQRPGMPAGATCSALQASERVACEQGQHKDVQPTQIQGGALSTSPASQSQTNQHESSGGTATASTRPTNGDAAATTSTTSTATSTAFPDKDDQKPAERNELIQLDKQVDQTSSADRAEDEHEHDQHNHHHDGREDQAELAQTDRLEDQIDHEQASDPKVAPAASAHSDTSVKAGISDGAKSTHHRP